MPAPSIRQKRSIFSALGIPRLGLLLLTLLLGCNRTVAPPTAEVRKTKAEPKAAAESTEPAASAARTAALIDMDRTPAGALLEQRLSKSTSLTWLERENLATLLKEQELQTLFSPQAGARRTALGQLLKVDLLVLLRSVMDPDGKEPKPLVHLVVCETRDGLRLCSQTLPVKDLQECVAEMERQVQTALRKQQEEIRVIWAVPPFVSKDLRYQFDYLKAAYARLVEQVLLAQKGTLVVELAEAESIAREHQLTGSEARPQRQLPLYFLGEYRNEGTGDKHQVSVGLKLKQGERILGGAEQANLTADKVPAFLIQATEELIKKASQVEQQKFNADTEVSQLAARARTFLRLGDWREALALLEASLLLKPSQAALHHEGALACSMLAQDYHGRNMHKKMVGGKFDPKKEGDPKALALAFQYYIRGLEHEETYLNAEGKFPQPSVPNNKAQADRPVSFEVWNTSWMLAQGRTRSKDLQEEYDQMRKEQQSILLRLTRQRARNGWGDAHRYLSLALQTVPSLRERFALIGQMIVELQDLPGAKHWTFKFTDTIRENSIVGITIVQPYDSPEFQDFLKELATVPNKDVQAGLAEVRKFGLKIRADLERLKKEEESKFAKNTRSASPGGASLAQFGSEEVQFQSIPLSWKSPSGAALRVSLKGCLPIGPGTDCLWDNRVLYLMKEKGILQPIWTPKIKFRLTTVCYDGRYVWAGGCEDFGSPSLVVLDPSSEKIWEVTAQDGLPILSEEERSQRKSVVQKLAAAPLEPGKICLAGCFGRSWVANVSFDSVKEKAVVKVFHEAREVPNGSYKEKWKNPAIAFIPKYIFTLTAPGGDRPEKRVLIGRRDAGNIEPSSPLIVDPQKQTVEVMRELLLEVPPMAWTNHQGSMYFVGPAIWNREKKKFEQRLARIAFPGTTVETILPDVPPGWLVSKGDQLYLVGKEWGELNLTERKLRSMADKLPWPFDYLAPGIPQDMLERILPSSHYGLLAVVRSFNKTPNRLGFEILQVVIKKK